ncbi:unnamed protein product [Enterobius vermicularis]|uniref:mitogen-activated protein kinase kinase n=1 Tax=Enterobius vermicularis TaxID=51028 RepID=A0A0N4VJ40_ENTVE|nr:unnamed protein product [Enterobius vermicularis]
MQGRQDRLLRRPCLAGPISIPNQQPELQRFLADELVEQKYNEIKSRSGILTIVGKEFYCDKSDIEELSDLGRGAFGAVRKARCKKTNTLMAVKIIPLTDSADSNKRTVMDMDVIMQAHDCPYIVKCYGCFVYESEVRICMEMMTMCLEKLLIRAHKFPENIVRQITISALKALQYLKERMIMHRDVKPSNILIDLRGTIKMCDFGISGRLIDSSRAATNTKGCTAYLAPERVGSSTGNYGIKADVWSLGITLLELATGRHPYDGCKNDFELLTKINNDPPPQLLPSDNYSEEFCSFLSYCLKKKPDERRDYLFLLFIEVLDYLEYQEEKVLEEEAFTAFSI